MATGGRAQGRRRRLRARRGHPVARRAAHRLGVDLISRRQRRPAGGHQPPEGCGRRVGRAVPGDDVERLAGVLQADISRDVLLTGSGVNEAGTTFSVWSHLEWADTGASPSLCTSGNPPQVIRATMTVKWGDGLPRSRSARPHHQPAVRHGRPRRRLLIGADRGRQRAPNLPADTASLINVVVNVTPSGGSTTSYSPDQYGCVYLQEPLGNYNVSLASPSGGPTFIDYQENLTPSGSVTVSTAGIAAGVPAFHYDEAGTVSFASSATAPLASGMPISVSNSATLQPSGTAVVVAAGSSATSAQFFPYTTPYSVWYGDCTTHSGVTPEEPTSPATFTLSPEGSTSVQITGLDTLQLSVSRAPPASPPRPPTPPPPWRTHPLPVTAAPRRSPPTAWPGSAVRGRPTRAPPPSSIRPTRSPSPTTAPARLSPCRCRLPASSTTARPTLPAPPSR